MTDNALKTQLTDDMKTALKAKDSRRLGVIRLVLAAIKQKEIDDKAALGEAGMSDADILVLLDKMVKQRRDALTQYQDANRTDLADQEQFEIDIIQTYLPQPLSIEAIEQIIDEAITHSDAQGMQDMGKVMGIVKAQVQGRADMRAVSDTIKQKLS